MVALAQRNYPAVSFREADAECLPYSDACFDAVACVFGLIYEIPRLELLVLKTNPKRPIKGRALHMERPDLAIAEAFRVLRPGGVFVFTQWAADDELLAIVAAAVAAQGSLGWTICRRPRR